MIENFLGFLTHLSNDPYASLRFRSRSSLVSSAGSTPPKMARLIWMPLTLPGTFALIEFRINL
ncbi:hypothetical protein RvY_06168 [Ramazzottius varieornatus]|uniref:Uncharacterized protein n=1 Tax=Ramazzottius varieornatus TaxID=947166 RepID=A0A1D1V7A3_RAMVA|nr:hypothetical protein RvY_06168 [Ramazzottius varieornatus]